MLLLADAMLTNILAIVIGLVVGIVVFGLLYLLAVLPGRNKGEKPVEEKAAPAPAPVKEEKAEETEEPVEEVVEEKAEEPVEEVVDETVVEEVVEEKAEEPVEEVVEETVVEEVVEEKVEEPVEEEPKPVKKTTKVVKEEEEDDDDDGEEGEAVTEETEEARAEREAAIAAAPELEAQQSFDRSYKARLIQSSELRKEWYSEVKNAALSFKNAKSSIAWKQESVKVGQTLLCKLVIRGKTLCIYLPLNVSDCDEKIKVEDISNKAVNAGTPTMLRIKNPLRVKQAGELLAQAAGNLGLEPMDKRKYNYAADIPLQTTEQLIEDGLVKITEKKSYPRKK